MSMQDVSYSQALVDAAEQYVRNPARTSDAQLALLLKFEPGRNFWKAAAEIFLHLRRGANIQAP